MERMNLLDHDIDAMKRVRMEVASCGFASATLASGGGSKSYTRTDISKLTEAIKSMTKELADLRIMLRNESSSRIDLSRKVLTVYA